VVTMAQIMDANASAGFYFFSPDTMECFKSQVPGQTPVRAEFTDDLYFFFTSEIYGPKQPRRFHVRTFRPSTGDCGSGAGADFGTMNAAKAAILLFAQGRFSEGYKWALANTGNNWFDEGWNSVNQEYIEYTNRQSEEIYLIQEMRK